MIIPPITKSLLILNTILFVLKLFLETKLIDLDIILGAFFPLSANFKYFQIITHMFMHAGFAHFLFNMFALWMFGSAVENQFGPKRYLFYYFLCGLGSFFLFNLVNYWELQNMHSAIVSEGGNVSSINQYVKWNIHGFYDEKGFYNRINEWGALQPSSINRELLKEYFYAFTIPMLGASGAIFGLLIAYGMMFPNEELMLIFLPIPIKAKYFIPLLVLYELFAGIGSMRSESTDSIAHFAHLGGAIIGFIYTRNYLKKNKIYDNN